MIRRYSIAASILLTLVLLPVVFASGSARERPQIIVANCGTGSTSLEANLTQVVPGSSGTVLFSCGSAGDAITVTSRGSVRPKFSIPAGYTSLGISSDPGCSSVFGLVSGSALRFGRGNHKAPITSYNYCASFSQAPAAGLQSFTIIWSATHTSNHPQGDTDENDSDGG